MKEAELDVDTTVGKSGGTDDSGSGNHADQSVNNQAPADAGADHPTDVKADRIPGEVSSEVDKPMMMNSMHKKQESVNVSGLFAGNYVRVVEMATQNTVDRGVVRKVFQKEVYLQGGTQYHQDKYRFIRLA